MFKYRKVEQPKEPKPDNEIRVTSRTYISTNFKYIAGLLEEKRFDEIIIKATGNVISKAVALAIVVRKRFLGLHQISEIETTEMVDVYEPLEEGLDTVERKRLVCMMTIILSSNQLDTTHIGYQEPLPPDEVSSEPLSAAEGQTIPSGEELPHRSFRGRGGPRRGRGMMYSRGGGYSFRGRGRYWRGYGYPRDFPRYSREYPERGGGYGRDSPRGRRYVMSSRETNQTSNQIVFI
jgi:DNA-binding protein Alba